MEDDPRNLALIGNNPDRVAAYRHIVRTAAGAGFTLKNGGAAVPHVKLADPPDARPYQYAIHPRQRHIKFYIRRPASDTMTKAQRLFGAAAVGTNGGNEVTINVVDENMAKQLTAWRF